VINTSNGTVAQQLDYDEFGNVILDSNPGFQPFGFAGGLYDPTTSLVRFGSRDYDAQTGRWTFKDSTMFLGGPNFYAYCLNDPINLVDPKGFVPEGGNAFPVVIYPWHGASKSDVAAIQAALDKVLSTPTGKLLSETMMKTVGRPPCKIYVGFHQMTGSYYPKDIGDTTLPKVYINPDNIFKVPTTEGVQAAPMTAVLAHELAHAVFNLRGDEPGAIIFENLIRKELGLPLRIPPPVVPGPSPGFCPPERK